MNNSNKNNPKDITKKAVAIGTALGVVATLGANLNVKEAEARTRNTKPNKESRINSDKKFSYTKRPWTNVDKANAQSSEGYTSKNKEERKPSNNRKVKVPVSVSTTRK